MLTDLGPKVLEYNARFGDPETQSLMPLLDPKVDLAEVMLACTQARLHQIEIAISPLYACNVVIAAGGYPESYRKGDVVKIGKLPEGMPLICLLFTNISLTESYQASILFHAGTKLLGNDIITAGGRVFSMVGVGRTLREAVDTAYTGVQSITFSGMFYRKDIGHR
jgi:phosphoribosylamine-glycine ligase